METARRDEKKHSYTEFLSALMTWGWLLDRAGELLDHGTSLPGDTVAELENAKAYAVKTYASVLVVADEHARTEIEYGFFDHLDIHSKYVRFGKLNETDYLELNEAQDWVRRRARDELGIQSIADPDPSP